MARWLKFFVVATLFELLHHGVSKLLQCVPLWWHLKLACLLYLHLPLFNGATNLFDRFTDHVSLKPGDSNVRGRDSATGSTTPSNSAGSGSEAEIEADTETEAEAGARTKAGAQTPVLRRRNRSKSPARRAKQGEIGAQPEAEAEVEAAAEPEREAR